MAWIASGYVVDCTRLMRQVVGFALGYSSSPRRSFSRAPVIEARYIFRFDFAALKVLYSTGGNHEHNWRKDKQVETLILDKERLGWVMQALQTNFKQGSKGLPSALANGFSMAFLCQSCT